MRIVVRKRALLNLRTGVVDNASVSLDLPYRCKVTHLCRNYGPLVCRNGRINTLGQRTSRWLNRLDDGSQKPVVQASSTGVTARRRVLH